MKQHITVLLVMAVTTFSMPINAESIPPLRFNCVGSKVTAEFNFTQDSEWLGAVQTKLTVGTDFGETTVLNFFTGSFGAECRSNSLGWGEYVVFQTACPARPSPKDKAAPCDFKNSFGIIKGAETLLVPQESNGKIAAQIFNYPSKSKEQLKSVKTQFNVHGK